MLHSGVFVHFELSSIVFSPHKHFQERKISDVWVIMMGQLANKATGDAYVVSVEKLLPSNLQSVQKAVDNPEEEQMVREEEKDVSWSDEVRKAGEQMEAKGEETWRGDGVPMLGVEREVMNSGESSIDVGPVRAVMRVASHFGTPNHYSM